MPFPLKFSDIHYCNILYILNGTVVINKGQCHMKYQRVMTYVMNYDANNLYIVFERRVGEGASLDADSTCLLSLVWSCLVLLSMIG